MSGGANYRRRFGIEEQPLEEFIESESQYHAVQYLRHFESFRIIWDKNQNINIIDELSYI